jgi:hypothetical protein
MKEELARGLRIYPHVIDVPGADDETRVADLPTADEGFVAVARKPVVVTTPLLLRLRNGLIVRTQFRMRATVGKLKEALVDVVGAPPSEMILGFGEEDLPDDAVIAELGLPEHACIDVSTLGDDENEGL